MSTLSEFIFNKFNENHDEMGRFSSGDGASSSSMGGSGLTRGQMNGLGRQTDTYRERVYGAEASVKENQQVIRGTMEKPTAPAYPREEIATAKANGDMRRWFELNAQYEKDYKAYSRAFTKYENDAKVVNIQSDLGKEHLDGSKAGVTNYVDSVINSDWFLKSYGNGGAMGQPAVKVTTVKSYAGQYSSGMNVNTLAINAPWATSEPTILHEIAHYAQTVSATTNYAAHGVEFANINLHITENVVGKEAADKLAEAYIRNGVPIGRK